MIITNILTNFVLFFFLFSFRQQKKKPPRFFINCPSTRLNCFLTFWFFFSEYNYNKHDRLFSDARVEGRGRNTNLFYQLSRRRSMFQTKKKAHLTSRKFGKSILLIYLEKKIRARYEYVCSIINGRKSCEWYHCLLSVLENNDVICTFHMINR